MSVYRTFIPFLPACFMLLVSSKKMFAQEAGADTAFYGQALIKSRALYYESFGDCSALYNGSKYDAYSFVFKDGHPFFKSARPAMGSVLYDGIIYDSVLMNYDEITDVLVINDNGPRIRLLNEKVEYFNLLNADFIRMVRDSLPGLESTGFYNILYNGKISLLKRQIKTIRESISTNVEIERYIDQKDHYYIKKDDRIYSIKSSKDLLALMGEKKREVQQFIKAGKLSFRSDPQKMLTSATAYYDTLKN